MALPTTERTDTGYDDLDLWSDVRLVDAMAASQRDALAAVGAAGAAICLSNGLAWSTLGAWAIAPAEPISKVAIASAAIGLRMSSSVVRCGSNGRTPAITDRQSRAPPRMFIGSFVRRSLA